MQRNRTFSAYSPDSLKVLRALREDSGAWHYSLRLGRTAGVAAGGLYPVLVRLEKTGLLESRWDDALPGSTRRRRLYRLTDSGRRVASAAAVEHAATRVESRRRRFNFGFARPQGQPG